MTTEVLDIVIREQGARRVAAGIDRIGQRANTATRSLFLLQRAIFVLGAAGAVRGIQQTIDTFRNFQNRLLLVTDSTQNLIDVTRELFDISARSRTGFEGTATIFSRTALSARSLGKSQEELLSFTELLNKATILSGAGAQEANAALIQLSQGISSNRLSGDELRSVLEQLPFVADIISRELGVARGDLRELGAQGRISGEVVIDAFLNASDVIQRAFGETVPTIGQAFTVLQTRATQFAGILDESLNISGNVSKAILTLADNLNTLAAAAISAGAAFAAVQIAGPLMRMSRFSRAVREGSAVLRGSREEAVQRARANVDLARTQAAAASADVLYSQAAIDRAKAVRDSLEIDRRKAEGFLKLERGYTRKTGILRSLQIAELKYNRAQEKVERANRVLIGLEGRQVRSRASLEAATLALEASQFELARRVELNSNAWGRFQRRFPVLAQALTTVRDAFANVFRIIARNPLTIFLTTIAATVANLFVFRKEIKLTEDGVVTLQDATIAAFQLIGESVSFITDPIRDVFTFLFDTIKSGIELIVGDLTELFKDFLRLLKLLGNNIIANIVLPFRIAGVLGDQLPIVFGNIQNAVVDALEDIVLAGRTAISFIEIGFKSSAVVVTNSFRLVGAVIKDIFQRIVSALATAINPVADTINSTLEGIGASFRLPRIDAGEISYFDDTLREIRERNRRELSELELTVPVRPDFSDLRSDRAGATSIGQSVSDVVQDTMNEDFIGNAYDAVIERAREIAAERLRNRELLDEEPAPGAGDVGARSGISFDELLRRLEKENELLKENTRQREVLREVLRFENRLKRELTDSEEDLVRATATANQLLTAQAELLDDIKSPLEDAAISVDALINLYERGQVSVAEFNQKIRELTFDWIEAQAQLGNSDFTGGFLLGLENTLTGLRSFAVEAGNIFGSIADGIGNQLGNAIADVILDAEDLQTALRNVAGAILRELISSLVRLGVRYALNAALAGTLAATATAAQLAQAATLATAFAPAAAAVSLATSGANAAPAQAGISSTFALSTGLAVLPGFRRGADFMVGGSGGPDSQMVAFRASPDERVIVETPSQRRRDDVPAPSGPRITININGVKDHDSFRRNEDQIRAVMARELDRAQKRNG